MHSTILGLVCHSNSQAYKLMLKDNIILSVNYIMYIHFSVKKPPMYTTLQLLYTLRFLYTQIKEL